MEVSDMHKEKVHRQLQGNLAAGLPGKINYGGVVGTYRRRDKQKREKYGRWASGEHHDARKKRNITSGKRAPKRSSKRSPKERHVSDGQPATTDNDRGRRPIHRCRACNLWVGAGRQVFFGEPRVPLPNKITMAPSLPHLSRRKPQASTGVPRSGCVRQRVNREDRRMDPGTDN